MTGIAESTPEQATGASPRPSVRSLLAATEVDVRLLGMLGALVVILVGFHILSGGKLINPANMVTLAVQATGMAIMATGMVLIIVSRNIDLSVGSQVGVTAMVYAVLMTDILPNVLGIPVGAPYMWIVALALGVALGAFIGAFQGFIIAYVGVPSFVVTLGGLLALRGTVWVLSEGASVDRHRQYVPPGRRRRPRVARRRGDVAPRHPRMRRHRRIRHLQPPAATCDSASRCGRCGPRS